MTLIWPTIEFFSVKLGLYPSARSECGMMMILRRLRRISDPPPYPRPVRPRHCIHPEGRIVGPIEMHMAHIRACKTQNTVRRTTRNPKLEASA
ncbi:hypothetical protein TRVA0_001S09758 [Trichomonascus vanleenenianus]|uniref:uncharacterized protein n=1 Tax=Trichomonascus vanleenenianus TaxID=2268995 RepID=UPI003ECB236D